MGIASSTGSLLSINLYLYDGESLWPPKALIRILDNTDYTLLLIVYTEVEQ